MTILLNILVVNAVVVVPLAAAVWGASRFVRRPALCHVLWVLVLLKLITPPFFQLPFTISIPIAAETTLTNNESILEPAVTVFVNESGTTAPALDSLTVASGDPDRGKAVAANAESLIATAPPFSIETSTSWYHKLGALARSTIGRSLSDPLVIWTVLSLWCFGSVAWFTHQLLYGLRFWRSIRYGSSTDRGLQHQADQLAKRFHLRRCPQVLLVHAQLSPMLCGYGSRLRLLFPADLARRLDHDARGTLLAHEMAHYARGDHWIRVLELLVTGIFWWHPIVWLARRQIEESEEECCDAWVVSELPHTPRRYAEALLDTIDYLCDKPKPLPPLASGLGPAAFLRRRLTRIMQGAPPKELSTSQRCGVALIALLALPMQPFVLGSHAAARISRTMALPIDRLESDSIPSSMELESVEQVEASDANSSPTSSGPPARTSPPTSKAIRSTRGERIYGSAVSSNGRFAIQKTTARRVLLANLATGEFSDLSLQELTSVAFFPDGNSFVAGGSDGRVTIWSAITGEPIRTLYLHDDVVRSIAVSPQGDLVAIGGRDGSAQLIRVATSQVVTELSRAVAAVNCVRFSPDGQRLAVAVGDWNSNDAGQVAIWNLKTGQADSVLACESAPGAVCFVSNDELIVGQWNGHTSLWNLVNRQVVGQGMANKDHVTAASFSPDNPLLREIPLVAAFQSNDVSFIESATSNAEIEVP